MIDQAQIRYTIGGDELRVAISGPVDFTAHGQLDDLFVYVSRAQAARVVVDLRLATLVDTYVLGFLVRLHNHQHRRGRRLVLTEVPPVVATAIELTGLSNILVVDP